MSLLSCRPIVYIGQDALGSACIMSTFGRALILGFVQQPISAVPTWPPSLSSSKRLKPTSFRSRKMPKLSEEFRTNCQIINTAVAR